MRKKKPVKTFIKKKDIALTTTRSFAPTLPKLEFPSISRIITEARAKIRTVTADLWVLIGFSTGILLMGIIISSVSLWQTMIVLDHSTTLRSETLSQIRYWQGVVRKHEDYRDGYVKLAALYYQLQDMSHAHEYVGKALAIDPADTKTRELSDRITRGN